MPTPIHTRAPRGKAPLPALVAALSVCVAGCGGPPQNTQTDATRPDSVNVAAGQVTHLESAILDETRELRIYLPETYRGSTFRYPVLYLLDAEGEFLHTVGIVEFLAGIDRIPELIVVGVVNTNRSRDLTPESADTEETAFWDEVGGADRFRRFFREELVPFVDRAYRTESFRIVRGQSFGGLFALHDAMSPSPVFDAVLASSPAVGWNFDHLVTRAPAFFADGMPRPIYLASAGNDFEGNLASILEFVRVVAATAPPSALWRHEHFKDEGHYSLAHLSTYRGLEFLYSGWPVPEDVAASADFARYESHFARLSERFGYTIRIPLRSIVRLGNRLLRERRYDDGIAVFERGLGLYPDQPEVHWRTGDAYRLAGRIEEARPHFEMAYRIALARSAPDAEDYRRTLDELDDPR